MGLLRSPFAGQVGSPHRRSHKGCDVQDLCGSGLDPRMGRKAAPMS